MLKSVFYPCTILVILFYLMLHEKPHHPRTNMQVLCHSMLLCDMHLRGLVIQESKVCIHSCVCNLSHSCSICICWVLLLQKGKELIPMTHQNCHMMAQINDEFSSNH